MFLKKVKSNALWSKLVILNPIVNNLKFLIASKCQKMLAAKKMSKNWFGTVACLNFDKKYWRVWLQQSVKRNEKTNKKCIKMINSQSQRRFEIPVLHFRSTFLIINNFIVFFWHIKLNYRFNWMAMIRYNWFFFPS